MKRKSIIISAAIMLGAVSIFGQSMMAAPSTDASAKCAQKAYAHKMQFGKVLNLTDDQKAKIKSKTTDAKARALSVRNDKNLTPDQQKSKLMEIRKSTRQQIMQVLTPEQRQKLTSLKSRDGGRQRGDRMKKAFAALNMTDSQKAQIKSIREDAKAQFKAVREDKSLTKDQIKAKAKSIRDASMEKMKTVLTPEQIKKIEDMKAKWKIRHSKGNELK